jgi:three-Cys-motif partner protein
MAQQKFFSEQAEQSDIKSKIVTKYFWAWANVIVSTIKNKANARIAYIDLFCGPGRYEDGTKSTPLLILEKAIADKKMRNLLVTVFNDKDVLNSKSLEKAIADLPGIDLLKYKPKVYHYEVGTDLVNQFKQLHLVPTLLLLILGGIRDYQ